MIALCQPLPAGEAVRLILSPPAGARTWQVLRRTTQAPAMPDEPGAVVVAPWGTYEAVVDTEGLVNGTAVHYRAFYRDAAGQALPPSDAKTVTPAYITRDTTVAYMDVLLRRFRAGLKAMVAQQRLTPKTGEIPVTRAPVATPDKVTLPMVSIHLGSDRPAERAISEELAAEELLTTGWDVTEGWYSEVTVNILATSNNADERDVLGRALKHIAVTNLAVFSAEGLIRPAFTLAHHDLLPEQKGAAVLFVAAGTFTCFVQSSATATEPEVADVVATTTPYNMEAIP